MVARLAKITVGGVPRYVDLIRATAVAGLPALPWDSHVGSPTSLTEEEQFVEDLVAATDRARQVILGTSAQGRTIRCVLVGPPRSRDQIRAANTVLIQGSIHGDEWAGREATFKFMLDHAQGSGTETYVWIPTMNPDGFTIPQRNLANNADSNRGWPPDGRDSRVSYAGTATTDAITNGALGALYPEQQCLRQAILLYRPKLIFDTHEYTSTTNTYRFDPGTTNGTGTAQAVINIDADVILTMRNAAVAAGYTIATYGGPIPNDGMTQALKLGGVPGVFTESGQDAVGGLVLRRAQQLSSMTALQAWVQTHASQLAIQAAAATWYTSFTPTVTDAYVPSGGGVTPGGPPAGVLFEGGFELGLIPPYSTTDIVGGTDNSANQYTTVEMDGNSVAENNVPTMSFDTTRLRNGRSTRSLHIVGRGRTSTGTGVASKRAQFRCAFPSKANPFFQPTDNGNDNEYWWGLSFYLGDGYDLSFITPTNFHNFFGPRQTTGETFYMTIQQNLGPGTITMRRAPGTFPDELGADQMHNSRLIEVGKWIDIVGHAKFSTTATNALREFWVQVDGDADWTHSGQQTSANCNIEGENTRFRLGVYTETNYDPDRHIWFDNVRIGSSFAAADPTGTT